jgi:ABC-type glycerol-3-phosphate transport system permease component
MSIAPSPPAAPAPRPPSAKRAHRPAARAAKVTAAGLALNLAVYAAAGVALLPFFWMICASLKRGEDLFAHAFLPWNDLGRLTLENFRQLLQREPLARWMINSLYLSSASTVLSVLLSSLGGFALAKYRFRGRRLLVAILLGTMMLPGVVLLPGSYMLMYGIGWIDSYAAILVPGAVSALGMFLFMQAMRQVPDELLQSARMDGCSELRLWWDIALPLVRPMIGAYTLLSFLGSWNAFLWPQIVLQDESRYPLPVALANMVALPEYRTEYGLLMAATCIAILPVMVLFFVLQRDFVAGLSSGALRG